MGAAFLWDNKVAGGTLSTGYTTIPVSSMPLSNLVDVQPRVRARWESTTATIQCDFGSSVAISCVALIGTNLTSAADVRWRMSDAELMVPATYDSGAQFALTTAEYNGNVILLHASSVSGRYMRLDIGQAGLSYIDVGRLVAGPVWRPTYGPAYGMQEGRLMLDRRDSNAFTGAQFPVPAAVNPRAASFTLASVTTAEAVAEYRDMKYAMGAANDALWIPDTSLAPNEMNARAIWGGVARPGEMAMIARNNFALSSRSFTLVERV